MTDRPLELALPGPAAAADRRAECAARTGAPPVRLDDEDAFGAFYSRTAAPLRSYLRRLTGDPGLADDLLQESFQRLLERRPAGLDEPGLAGWLYRTATRLAHDAWRRARRRRRWLPDPAPAPAAAGESELRRRAVEEALAQLSPRERALLWLAYVEGRDHREIAGVLGVARASVRVLLFRARRRTAKLLGGGADDQEDR
jgi:RNA polymerase sigma-70 factor (ECF subfamily)